MSASLSAGWFAFVWFMGETDDIPSSSEASHPMSSPAIATTAPPPKPPSRRVLRQLGIAGEFRHIAASGGPAAAVESLQVSSPVHGGIAAQVALKQAMADVAKAQRQQNKQQPSATTAAAETAESTTQSFTKGTARVAARAFEWLAPAVIAAAADVAATSSSTGSVAPSASTTALVHKSADQLLTGVAVALRALAAEAAKLHIAAQPAPKLHFVKPAAGKKKVLQPVPVEESDAASRQLLPRFSVWVSSTDVSAQLIALATAAAQPSQAAGQSAAVAATEDAIKACVGSAVRVISSASSVESAPAHRHVVLLSSEGDRHTAEVRKLLATASAGSVLLASCDEATVTSVLVAGGAATPTTPAGGSSSSAAIPVSVYTSVFDGTGKTCAIIAILKSYCSATSHHRVVLHVATKHCANFFEALLTSLAIHFPTGLTILNAATESLPSSSGAYTVVSYGAVYPRVAGGVAVTEANRPHLFVHVDPPASLATWLEYVRYLSPPVAPEAAAAPPVPATPAKKPAPKKGAATLAATAAAAASVQPPTLIAMILPPSELVSVPAGKETTATAKMPPRVLAGAVCQWMAEHGPAHGLKIRFEKLPAPSQGAVTLLSDTIQTRVAKVFTLSQLAYDAYRTLMLHWSHATPAALWGGENLRAVNLDAQAAVFGLSEAPLLDLRTKDTKFRSKEDYVKESKMLQKRVKRSRSATTTAEDAAAGSDDVPVAE
jgi:hypothetical protein